MKNILKNIAKNIFDFVVITFIIMIIVFFLIHSIPGSNEISSGLTDSQKRAIEAKYHLNEPLIKQFGIYVNNLFHGDLGVSLSFRPNANINSFLWNRFLVSFTVGSLALAITVVIGIPIGILAGSNPGKVVDVTSTIFTSIMISIPSMVLGLFLLLAGKKIGLPYIYDIKDLKSYILPALTLGIAPTIAYIRYISTELNRELFSMHAKFAYLKGATKFRFIVKHAIRPSMFPIVTFFPFAVLQTFLGGFFVERIFQIPGSGGLFLQSIQTKDYNIILILITIYTAITVLGYSLRDILYRVIDPRIRGQNV